MAVIRSQSWTPTHSPTIAGESGAETVAEGDWSGAVEGDTAELHAASSTAIARDAGRNLGPLIPSRRVYRQHGPLTGDALEDVDAPRLQHDAGAGDEVPDRA